MYKKNISLVLFLLFFLGLFFQYNRSNGFLYLLRNTNIAIDAVTNISNADVINTSEEFLIIYDTGNIRSLFLKHQIENLLRMQKKNFHAISYNTNIDWSKKYTAVIVTFGNINLLGNTTPYEKYVLAGGSMCFAEAINSPYIGDISGKLGIATMGEGITSYGLKLESDILIKGKGFELTSTTTQIFLNNHKLLPTASIHINSQENIPIVWEHPYGKGKFIVYNGVNLGHKSNVGILSGLLSLTKNNYIYPVLGIMAVFIDDFPAPIPEGNFDKIHQEFQLSTADFFRQIWWPEMLRISSSYDVKYTGLIIESYDVRVKPPFVPDTRVNPINLVVYGRELLKSGGELGIHGYNHLPLTTSDHNNNTIYNSWQTQEDMLTSLQELRRYVKEFFPDYQIRAYVPPDNILSPDGKAAIQEIFPEIKIFCSFYEGYKKEGSYYQTFAMNSDGTFEFPRVTTGFVPNNYMQWISLNVLSTWGVFSHFVEPYEIFYEKDKDFSWQVFQKGFEKIISTNKLDYPWLRPTTASEAIEYMADYFNANYTLEETADEIIINCENFRKEMFFILKTNRKIAKVQDCQFEIIDSTSYLIKTSKNTAKIIFERE